MKISVETSSGLERRMTIEIPAEQIENEVDIRLVKVGRSARLKGFRPGKVPPRVIRERYGLQVRQEVLEDLIQSSYSSAIEQERLRPAAQPSIVPGQMQEGADFSFTATFEVYPDIEIAGLDSLAIEQAQTTVTDADVDEMVETLRKQRGEWSPVDREAADGDRVNIDFDGTLKGQPFEGGSGKDVPFVLGEGRMLEGFEKNIKGLAAGEKKSFKMKFPKDYPAGELAGKKVEFAVMVKEVAEPQLPELDAEFVKSFGIDSGEVEALRADVRHNMEREVEARRQADTKRQVMEQLLRANPIDVPSTLVDQEAVSLRAESLRNMGIEGDDPNAPPIAEFRDAAERRVRLGLLVGALIQDNGIEVDRERLKAKVDEICAPYDRKDEIRQMYFQNPRLIGQVENMVLEEQVVAWLIDKSQLTRRNVSFSELMETE